MKKSKNNWNDKEFRNKYKREWYAKNKKVKVEPSAVDSEIKIEHGIPITKCSAEGLYTPIFRKMKVGDSFVAPMKSRSSMGCISVRLGMKATTRKIDAEHIRVWRVK